MKFEIRGNNVLVYLGLIPPTEDAGDFPHHQDEFCGNIFRRAWGYPEGKYPLDMSQIHTGPMILDIHSSIEKPQKHKSVLKSGSTNNFGFELD